MAQRILSSAGAAARLGRINEPRRNSAATLCLLRSLGLSRSSQVWLVPGSKAPKISSEPSCFHERKSLVVLDDCVVL